MYPMLSPALRSDLERERERDREMARRRRQHHEALRAPSSAAASRHSGADPPRVPAADPAEEQSGLEKVR